MKFGADVIKADPTDDPVDYHQVIQIAGRIPVLVRGGGRVSDEEILQRTHAGEGCQALVITSEGSDCFDLGPQMP